MTTTEAKVINALCENKDMHTALIEDAEIFGPYGDVFETIRNYYLQFKTVPNIGVVQDKHPDIEIVDVDAPTSYYLNELKNEFVETRMQELMLKASSALQTTPPAKVLEKLQTAMAKLGRHATASRDLDLTDADAAQDHFEKVKQIADERGGVPGIPTGFKSIDSAYPTGMAPGHLIVPMGYTGRAKSLFTALIAVKAWSMGYKPMIISLEMTPEEQRDRVYPMMSSGLFKNSDLSRGDVIIDDFRTWSNRAFKDKNGFVVVSNQGMTAITPNVVQSKIDMHRPDLVICDYAQIMMDNAHTAGMTPRMMNLSRELKMTAVANNLPIIMITAVTDEDGDKRDSPPLLSQVAWSTAIEYDSNLVFAVHRHEDQNAVEIVGRKNRNGDLFAFYFDVDFDRGIWNESH